MKSNYYYLPLFFIIFSKLCLGATYSYPNTSGTINASPSALSSLGIHIAPGDTLNIQPGTYRALKATGLNGTASQPITIRCSATTDFSAAAFHFDYEILNCSHVIFDGIKVSRHTNATFHALHGDTHDITYQNCSFSGFSGQNAIQVGVNFTPKTFNGTRASAFYHLKWINCLFDNMADASCIHCTRGVTLDCEVTNCTFKNVTPSSASSVPIPLYIFGFGWKVNNCVFDKINGPAGHNGCIYLYGYAQVTRCLFKGSWANGVRCFPMALNFENYANGENRFYNNIFRDTTKYGLFEINTNNTNSYLTDGTGYFLNNTRNFIYHNTLYRSFAETYQAYLIDVYGSNATVRGNLVIEPQIDKPYNPSTNYVVYLNNGFHFPASATQSNNVTVQTANPSHIDTGTLTPKSGSPLLDNMPTRIPYITMDFYGNARKSGSAADVGAAEFQQSTFSYANDGIDDAWQIEHFGQNNADAAPTADYSGNGQTNFFKFIAGLDPIDPASRFTLRLEPQPGSPARRSLVFSPIVAGRNYTVQASPNLGGANTWSALTGTSQSDAGNARTVVETSALDARKFYRILIEKL